MRFGFSSVLSALSGVPRFLVRGASTTRCSSLILPLPIVIGSKSLEDGPTAIVMMMVVDSHRTQGSSWIRVQDASISVRAERQRQVYLIIACRYATVGIKTRLGTASWIHSPYQAYQERSRQSCIWLSYRDISGCDLARGCGEQICGAACDSESSYHHIAAPCRHCGRVSEVGHSHSPDLNGVLLLDFMGIW